VDNLYVVDTSFFPSSSAVNPALTAIANSLRVGDHLIERLGATVEKGSRFGRAGDGAGTKGTTRDAKQEEVTA
jgi:choline dehydrogenase-like flavoprotein